MRKLAFVVLVLLLSACGGSSSSIIGTWEGSSGTLGIRLQIDGAGGAAFYNTGRGFFYGGTITARQSGQTLTVISPLYDGSGQLIFDGVVSGDSYSGTLTAFDYDSVVAVNSFRLFRF